ncbi:MAG: hypothetical protein ACRERE_06115 [Candidatus Entotheonellia bacterium]
MATIDINRIPYGWATTAGDLTIEATNPHFDRGAIRARFTVRNCTVIHFLDTANLTSERSRARIIGKLAEKGVTLDERLIIAMDEACRTRPRPEEIVVCDGGGDFAEKVCSYPVLLEKVTDFLLLNDPDVLPTMLGAFAAHRFGGTPVWLLIVAPPSGTKTELIRALWGAPGVYPLSELTSKTFASGLETHGEDPSLLHRLTDEVLVLKDLTTVLEMYQEERQAILAQLREIYDGRFDKAWGTGKELHWQGRLGFLAGVTPIIDSYHSVLSVLGERFVLFRMIQPDRAKSARKSLENAKVEPKMRASLAGAVQGFIAGLPTTPPEVPIGALDRLVNLANFVTRCRSGVVRDRYRRELEYVPEPEMPARFVKQLFELLRGVALVLGHKEATAEDMDRVARVALDSIPAVRRVVLRAVATMSTVDDTLKTTTISQAVQYASATVRRALEDLQALGILEVVKGGPGKADAWRPHEEWTPALDTLKTVDLLTAARSEQTFSAKSPPPVTHTYFRRSLPDLWQRRLAGHPRRRCCLPIVREECLRCSTTSRSSAA